MKKIITYQAIILWICLFYSSCQKGELYDISEKQTEKFINLTLQGYILQDTLEFIKEGKVIYIGYETNFQNQDTLELYSIVSATEIYVRKKGSTTNLDTISLESDTFRKTVRIFYDGKKITDNIEITPISAANKFGLRLAYLANPTYNTGPEVDVEIFEMQMITDPITKKFRREYKSIQIIKNVGKDFGDFIELDELDMSDPYNKRYYVFKLYQPNSKKYPFKENVNFQDPPIENVYSNMSLQEGKSHLIQIQPDFYEGYFQFYNVLNIAMFFE